MTVPSRKEGRQRLALALQNTVGITSLVPAAQILNYKPTQPGGLSPLLGVQSLGGDDPALTQLFNKSELDLAIVALVILTKESWTESQAEDLLDEINQQVRQFLQDNQGTQEGLWTGLKRNGRSQVSYFVPVAGMVYLQETYPLVMVIA